MDANQEKSFQRLTANLEELTKLYRGLLDLVRKEKEYLVEANIEKLEQNNVAKEDVLYKIRGQDSFREKYAKEFAALIGGNVQSPRLLELAQILGNNPAGARLRSMHAALEVLIGRISQLNKDNEAYAQAALNTLNGAIGEIKDSVSGKKTYGQKGKMAHGPDKAGNFVHKEA